MIEWAARPRMRTALTILALTVGSVLGAGVLIAGGILVREGAIHDIADGTGVVAYPVQGDLREPTAIAFAPSGEMIVAEARGTISVFSSGDADAERLAVSTMPGVSTRGASGLLSLALDRDFGTNRLLYACASRDPGDGGPRTNQLLRLTAAADWVISLDRVVANLGRAQPDRNGCGIAVDDEGNVMVGVGDARDPRAVFSRHTLLGKIVEVPFDRAREVVEAIRDRKVLRYVIATGLRDPRAIVPVGDTFYVADGGPAGQDEVDELVTDGDYGWPCLVALEPSDAPQASGPTWEERCAESEATRRPPAWSAAVDRRIGIASLAPLSGDRWGPWAGALMVSAASAGEVLLLEPGGDGYVEAEALFDRWSWRPGPMAVGPTGEVFVGVTTGATAEIMRIGPSD